jgi:hypothetical protein
MWVFRCGPNRKEGASFRSLEVLKAWDLEKRIYKSDYGRLIEWDFQLTAADGPFHVPCGINLWPFLLLILATIHSSCLRPYQTRLASRFNY